MLTVMAGAAARGLPDGIRRACLLLSQGPAAVLTGCSGAHTSNPGTNLAAATSHANLHTSCAPHLPQYGGYMRTGQAANAFDSGEGEQAMRVLVTGACGQVGSELVPFLRQRLGVENVIASDVKTSRAVTEGGGIFAYCDVQDKDHLTRIVLEYGINYIVHLATLLSAVGERNPQLALRINTAGIQNVLDLAATHSLQVYSPSTIAVFGSSAPRVNTPDDTILQPSTMYGITKVHAELLGQYYRDRFNVDYRSLRYPGIISSSTAPGGGTTDYAVEIFHAALRSKAYTCFLSEGAALPMMYMPDCLEATWQLMMAPRESLTRTTYNVTAMSFSPKQLAEAIQRHVPDFTITYTPDFRDQIARTWPDSLDDSNARRDWGWKPSFDVDLMTADMLAKLAEQNKRAAATAAAGAAAGAARAKGGRVAVAAAAFSANGSGRAQAVVASSGVAGDNGVAAVAVGDAAEEALPWHNPS